MYDTNITSKITDSKTREVDYGRDIADLAGVVTQLQHEVVKLSMLVSQLRKQLEDQGTLYGVAGYTRPHWLDTRYGLDSSEKKIDIDWTNLRVNKENAFE